MKLYVGNLAFETTEEDLRSMFASHGEIVSTRIITDRETGGSRGFGFVEMAQRTDGEKAVLGLDGSDMHGRKLTVNEAKPQTSRR